MPITYICPSDPSSPAARGQTGYVAVVGPGTLFDKDEGVSFQEVTDGTSNTLMVAETKQLVPWTKPDDLAMPPGGGVPPFGSNHTGGFNVLFADGSVRYIKLTINPVVLRALMTRSGGEVVSTDSF
jgi:prepilin-type processing-associated H-X9-DG protein